MTDLGNDEISLPQKANQATLINTLPFIASLIFAAVMFSQAIYQLRMFADDDRPRLFAFSCIFPFVFALPRFLPVSKLTVSLLKTFTP